ncbi:hypothetical protein P8C59_008000 [Phyllachora maydis]|uniref:Uncharacterized protein n=1 Tax=Phyllachora maydis TaxID=1825666 RepID=A0AAD9IAL0_9PEZI|nr:hypothetical protein P8C59_008000 [Phyllachora maydis]
MDPSKYSKPRHVSRLKKEMYEQRLRNNPLSSPPSSTGSHDTVSTTSEDATRDLSDFSFNPDGEGTRKLGEGGHPEVKKVSKTEKARTVIHTSVLAERFPGWSRLGRNNNSILAKSLTTGSLPVPDAEKENVAPPSYDSTVDKHTFEHLLNSKRKRTQAEMQPRVDDDSESTTALSSTPVRPLATTRRSRFARSNDSSPAPTQEGKAPLADAASKTRGNRVASVEDVVSSRSPPKQTAGQPATSKRIDQFIISSPAANTSAFNATGRSFILPAFRYLPQWTSGALKVSTKDGSLVLVKSRKARDRLGQVREHDTLDGVGIPEEDEQMFVSMDQLREEVRELHDHDEMLQREAESLQLEIGRLQSELAKYKSRKRSDSAIGSASESDNSMNRRLGAQNHELERKIAQLQERLDQANRQLGVNDIHSAALTAERDEALHQASVARERAQRLQDELGLTQKDINAGLRHRQERDTLQLEVTSLRATNETLQRQHESAIKSSQTLATQHENLRREFTALQKELAAVREELASLRREHGALLDRNRMIQGDHASMERNNDSYFQENKKLQAQLRHRDQHIAELRSAIADRDKVIDSMQNMTSNTTVHERNDHLEADVELLQEQLDQRREEVKAKDESIAARDVRIRSLKEQAAQLAREKQNLLRENARLASEQLDLDGQRAEDRHTMARLQRLVSKNTADHLKTVEDTTQDCIRLERDFKQREAAYTQKIERQKAALKKMKVVSKLIAEMQQDVTIDLTKTSRIASAKESGQAGGGRGSTSEVSAKTILLHVDEDPTTEIPELEGSDFSSILGDQIPRLRQIYRELKYRQEEEEEDDDDEMDGEAAGETAQFTDISLPPLPSAPVVRGAKVDETKTVAKVHGGLSKEQPVGILKKPRPSHREEDTGRASVKSGVSVASARTMESTEYTSTSAQRDRDSKKLSTLPGPVGRPPSRQQSGVEGGQDMTELNMTSAFILPDITLRSAQRTGKTTHGHVQHPGPSSLSQDARRVLDEVSDHNCCNCVICTRILANGGGVISSSSTSAHPAKLVLTVEEARRGKKTVRIEKPVPVSDQTPATAGEGDVDMGDMTIRPKQSPGEALAALIKETRDELSHLEMRIRQLHEAYFGGDKAKNDRHHKALMADLLQQQREAEVKRCQLYKLHDVLEGQKAAGQMMVEDVDLTVLSNLNLNIEVGAEGTATKGESREGSDWAGFA